MSKAKKTLFDPVVKSDKLNPKFELIRSNPASEPTRWMLDEVYRTLDDPDGNLVEQFQTTGFDARYFELYLHAYFTRSGYVVTRPRPNPDFLVSRDGFQVAVEATTVNPPTSGVLKEKGRVFSDIAKEDVRDYLGNELAMRFGSPLYSKLQKKYWELPNCRGLPFVIAVEEFIEDSPLRVGDSALGRYVFGLDQTGNWDRDGRLWVAAQPVTEHVVEEKRIPSGFFDLPGAEHVSAVLFTNSGTSAKFSRMGFQHGVGNNRITMIRKGFAFTMDHDAMDPTLFSYDLDAPPLVETWGQGLVVLHNPRCECPVPRDFFVDAVQTYIQDGLQKSDHVSWHPLSSQTMICDLHDAKEKLAKLPYRTPTIAVAPIRKVGYQIMSGHTTKDNPLLEEAGWYADETESFLGIVLRSREENTWGFRVLARDMKFVFQPIKTGQGCDSREDALQMLYLEIAGLLQAPQRIFPQGDEFSTV